MNLRLRLAVILSLMLLAALFFNVARGVMLTRDQVALEMQSTARLASELLGLILSDPDLDLQSGRAGEVMNRLVRLESVRHLSIDILPPGSSAFPAGGELAADVPAWFVALVLPRPRRVISSYGGGSEPRLLVRSNPADEIEEAWSSIRNSLIIGLGSLLLFNAVLYLFLSRWLQPVEAFGRTLEDIERGDFSRRIPRMRLPEFAVIAEKMNRLTSVLGASKSENERLTRKSLMIQEQERRHLAQELHDAMGQSISAIKAMAVTIIQRSRDGDPLIIESARKIEETSNGIYSSVRGMISRLRPSTLDELGLVIALQQMADDWNTHHGESFCRLRIEGEFDSLQEEQQINVYRIMQEALTNIARHSHADSVEITLSGREVISLSISDNGIGFDKEQVEKGMGLTGIRERVQILHGVLNIGARPRQGVSIHIEFPRISKHRRRRASDVWPPR